MDMHDQTEAQRIGREAGAAIAHALADNLEMIIMRLADSISKLQAEQERQAAHLDLETRRLDDYHRWLQRIDDRTR